MFMCIAHGYVSARFVKNIILSRMDYHEFRIRLGNRVKTIRMKKGISLLRMEEGEHAVSRRTCQEVEFSNQGVKVETLFRIANRLDVEVTEFFKFDKK